MSVIWIEPPIVQGIPAIVTVDLNEGRFLDEVGCLSCRAVVRAQIGMASPVRMYVVAITCDDCGEDLVTFDAFSKRAA